MEQVKDKDLPTITVITPTFNSALTLDKVFALVRSQNYPKSKIDIIIGDGGSTDKTVKIAKKYKAKVLKIPADIQNAEYNRGVAFNAAKGQLVLVLDHDNFLPYKNWLKDMVKPLLENPQMVATSTCYYTYKKEFKLMDRYFALFGTSEPLPFYLGKADRMPQTSKKWSLNGKAIDKGSYYLVRFEKDPRKIPSIGTNGCLLRRDILVKHADIRPDHHYPIDVMVDVVFAGYNEFGFVKNSITHLTHTRGMIAFLKRRKQFVEVYHFINYSKRRWSIYMPGDEGRLVLYIIYSLTIIKPTWDALMGFIKIPDVAWLVHPIMCLTTTLMYSYATLKTKLRVKHAEK